MVINEVGVGFEGGENVKEANKKSDGLHLVQDLLSTIEYIAQFGDYRRTQRKECHSMVRRMKVLLSLFEELRDVDTPISDNGITWLGNLKKIFCLAKKLLTTCNEGSKIYLVSSF